MNRIVRLRDLNGMQIGHFEEISPGDWRGVDHQRSGGICIYSWENLITRIADLIAEGTVWQLVGAGIIPSLAQIDIDRAGNIWLGHEYLRSQQYLPLLIPEKAES